MRTKLFSGASAEVTPYTKPNTHVALLDAALPGRKGGRGREGGKSGRMFIAGFVSYECLVLNCAGALDGNM